MNVTKAFLGTTALAGVLTWAAGAGATPEFPATVDSVLMLPTNWVESKVAPMDGCHLCHVNDPPTGMGPPMTAFGTLMLANGAVAYEASGTAGPALAAIEAMDPRFITDIKNGTNPNLDPNASSTTTDPVPQYGCGSVTGRTTAPSGPAAAALALALCIARRRRATRSPAP